MSEKEADISNLEIKLEILNLNYWEHYKFAQDLVRALGPKHPRYQKAQNSVNEVLNEINATRKEIEKIKTPS